VGKAKFFLSLLFAALLLAACASSSGDSDDSDDEDLDFSYSFKANYAVSDADGYANGHGSVYVYDYGAATAASSLTLDGIALSTSTPFSNNLTARSAGASIALSVTVGDRTYTGSAILPDLLLDVAYRQTGYLTVTGHSIDVDETAALDIEWSNLAVLTHPAAHARVEIVRGSSVVYEDEVPYAYAQLTVPAGKIQSGDYVYVYADNDAADIGPSTLLDEDATVFHVKNGTRVAAN
jgi:hypothetical protein